MRAILPGRSQSTRQALCTANWDGLRLVAYISGNTIIVFDGLRNLLQTIFVDDVESLLAVTIEESSGQIAVCDKQNIYLYRPFGREEGILRWAQIYRLPAEETQYFTCLSWGSSIELLAGGSQLVLWNISESDGPEQIWTQKLASPVILAYFAPGAGLIASCGQHDLLVKIWRRLSYEKDSTRFDVSYLRHPSAVTNIHWRKPWHAEQSLDELLYTFCNDNQIRAWTNVDQHISSTLQRIAIFDMNESIQPRRLSTGSICKKRYAFILDSRDFSSATEKAILNSSSGTDHALEHLIQIANRSPEICVILDGLGHMSVWGVENAGIKNKLPAEKFNVVLVDGVEIKLPTDESGAEEYIQFCTFSGGSDPSSISILVHSYTGHIEWYESPISKFFDTSARSGRVQLASSWSGHDSTILNMIPGRSRQKILSRSDDDEAIIWSQSSTGALLQQSQIDSSDDIVDAMLLDDENFVLALHQNLLTLWNVKAQQAKMVGYTSFSAQIKAQPLFLCRASTGQHSKPRIAVAVVFMNGQTELFYFYVSASKTVNGANDDSKIFRSAGVSLVSFVDQDLKLIRCNNIEPREYHIARSAVLNVTDDGVITRYDGVVDEDEELGWEASYKLPTMLANPKIFRSLTNGKIAVVDKTGQHLSIWDVYQGCCEYEQCFSAYEQIEKIKWSSTSNENLILVVSFAYQILTIGQTRFKSTQSHRAWIVMQEIRLRDFCTHPVGDLCCLGGSTVAVGAGNQIFVFDATTNVGPRKDKLKTDQVVDIDNAKLPIFHPEMLSRLAISGQGKLIEKICQQLNQELKYYSTGDSLASDLDMSVSILETSSKFYRTKSDQSSESPQTNGYDEDFSEVINQLQNSISNINTWQLCLSDKERLSVFLKNFMHVRNEQQSLDKYARYYLFHLLDTLEDQQLPWSAFIAASMSVSQEALLEIIHRRYESKITWPIAQRLGLFLWISEPESLRKQFENVGRAEYNKTPDDRSPIDCSLYYLALDKKQILQGLWRTTLGMKEKDNTMKLLANNFNESRWKATALKNAYALLSKRRFEYGAAFFLLGGSLVDAVNVCINQLEDIQLAIAIARVWDRGDDQQEQVLQKLINTSLIEMARRDEQGRTMAAWGFLHLGDYVNTIRLLALPTFEAFGLDLHNMDRDVVTVSSEGSSRVLKSMWYTANDPTSLLQLYVELREKLVSNKLWNRDALTLRQEWEFVMRCVRWYSRAGMDILALDLVTSWRFIPLQEKVRPNTNAAVTSKVEITETGQDTSVQKDPEKKKPPPTQFIEPSADSLLDSFGF